MCSVRRTGRRRVTVQPSNTQPHHTRCRNRTASARTRAARMGQVPRAASYRLTQINNVLMSALPKTLAPEISHRVIRIQVLTLLGMSVEAAVSFGAAGTAHGIEMAQSTVDKYLRRHGKPPSRTLRTFLTNHVEQMASIDFTVPTVTFRVLFVFIVLSHARRRRSHE